MALADILAAMEAAAAAEEASLLAAVEVEAEHLRVTAAAEVAAARGRLLQEAGAALRTERLRLDADARLQVTRQRAQLRDALVAAAFAQARDRLVGARARADYSHLLQALLVEALHEFPPREPVTVRCDRRDLPELTAAAPVTRRELTLEASLDCWGGVVVQDAAGGVVADNTLEQRLERARECLWPEVARRVLGG